MTEHIVVHVDESEQCEARVRAALDLARKRGAELTGVYAALVPALPVVAAGVPGAMAGYPVGMIDEKAREALEERMQRARVDFRRLAGTDSFCALQSPADSALVECGRYADLIVLGQSTDASAGRDVPGNLAASVMLRAGRPVLIIPDAGARQGIGERILVAWNNSRESTRALHDALPYLRDAGKVIVLTVGDVATRVDTGGDSTAGDDSAPPLLKLGAHLSNHGVDFELREIPQSDRDAGQEILEQLSKADCDLLVMGAYGHSRLREFVFGGTTREILKHMSVPVMMSH